MKIVEEYNQEGIPFSEVKPGDLFAYDGSYFMKVESDDDPEEIISWEGINHRGVKQTEFGVAVDMATGKLTFVKLNKLVPPIYARIRINGRAD